MTKKLAEIKQIAKEIILLETYENYEQDELIEVLLAADNMYYNDEESFLSDAEYDGLRRYTEQLNPNHSYFIGVGSEVRGGKVKLPYKMGSLTQVYEGDTAKWIKKYNLDQDDIIVTDKLDGSSALIVYDNNGDLQVAYSRGDGTEGADITRHLRKLPSVPQKVRNGGLVVRGEVIIAKKRFPLAQKCKTRNGQQYKNPRNMVAGLMNASKNPEEVYQHVDFVAYEIIKGGDHAGKNFMLNELALKHGFLVPEWQTYYGTELTDDHLTKHLNARRAVCDYEIDGVVLDVSNTDLRAKINPTKDTLNPEYARKFKVADVNNLAEATVIEVQWNISKHGYLKPRVKIEPTELVGVTIQHASGFNAKFIKDNMIGPGAVVRITRSGDVIPFILGTVKPAEVAQLPTEDCVWTVNDAGEEVDLVLKNKNNATVQFEQMNDFFASIDAPHLRDGNLRILFDNGFDTIEKVLKMSEKQMVGFIGANGSKIYKGLRLKLSNIPMYVLMGSHYAFGRGVGVRKMKKLWEAFKGDMTKCTSLKLVLTVESFKDKTADKIIDGYPVFEKFYNNIKDLVTISPYEEKASGSMTGQLVCFTGFRDKDLHAAVEAAGGTMQSGVSSKTTILVADDPTGDSGKLRKARENGTKVIGIDELKDML